MQAGLGSGNHSGSAKFNFSFYSYFAVVRLGILLGMSFLRYDLIQNLPFMNENNLKAFLFRVFPVKKIESVNQSPAIS